VRRSWAIAFCVDSNKTIKKQSSLCEVIINLAFESKKN